MDSARLLPREDLPPSRDTGEPWSEKHLTLQDVLRDAGRDAPVKMSNGR